VNSNATKTPADLVSVVMIFLNEKNFLQDAIRSVLAQTHENWELLLVDDGSNDGSSEIARSVAAEFPTKVQYLKHAGHQNLGMSASRNLGVRHAKGSYVAFLDADDVWLPRKLEQQLAILNAHPDADIVCGAVQWWYSWTGRTEDVQRDFVIRLNAPRNTLIQPPQLLLPLLQRETVTSTVSMIRREAITRVGGFEERFHGLYEDQAFFAKLCSKSVAYIANDCWYRWRKHSDSSCITAVSRGEYRAARLKFLLWLETYLSSLGMLNGDLRKTLRKQIWVSQHPFLNGILQTAGNPTWMKDTTLKIARRIVPVPIRRWLRAQVAGTEYVPPVGWVRFGSFRRREPFSREWAMDRGLPIDRYYIEKFLSEHSDDISGEVLEIGDDRYTRRFGSSKVTRSDVLNVTSVRHATIVADLTSANQIASDRFDCIICTQTLLFIYDVRAAIRTLYRTLKPGGVLLATIPGGFHPTSRFDRDRWGDYWRFTSLSAKLLFEEAFGNHVEIRPYGNVMAATAFINGLAVEDLIPKELDYCDPDYEVSITIRARKPSDIA
jgi:glycosyltransferase involved in cell wall biosynthesis/SAM-dependent methyltransferase